MSTHPSSNTDPTAGKPPSRRRRVLLSLRIFAAILVLFGLGSALWVGVPAYRRHVAIREIERTGGIFVDIQPRGPKWLRDRLGGKWSRLLDQIHWVELGPDATDSTLADLTALPELQRLFMGKSHRVTDAGLQQLTGMEMLESLDLSHTQVTDAGLDTLKGLPVLRWLDLTDTPICDLGVVKFKSFPRIDVVYLDGTSVTYDGYRDLVNSLPKLYVHHRAFITEQGTRFMHEHPVGRELPSEEQTRH